jgi:ATP-binding cassette subfamily B protein
VEIHKYRETWATLIGFVYAIGIALQFLLALYFYDNGMLTISNWILFITYQGCFKQMFWALDDFMTCIGDVEVTAVRGNDLYNPALFPVEKFGDVHLDNMQGKIELKNLDFEYIENRPVLENVSLNIEPNQVTALVGRSGEGKSTILSLIAKFYDAKDGQLFIDGHDINTLDAASIRTNISKIEQNPYIFNATFKENLLMVKPDATDEEIAAACKNSEIYDFIMSTERGFDTLVGENGITLSGGQKQRLAIARALLKSSKVIMFDESTSSLDNDSQRKIQQIIENLASDHTIVVVAHRLTTIKNADKIIFFNDHKVVATGTHEELMQTCEDYKNLYLNEDVE